MSPAFWIALAGLYLGFAIFLAGYAHGFSNRGRRKR